MYLSIEDQIRIRRDFITYEYNLYPFQSPDIIL